ncbi:hypothetical protein CH63R_14450 [Colletotrichum higginsianum IMI 349063]|uniref:Uncharacterized protein n=1 Tax=Colletotrichum higginsianum (strain IMI 349063) TaxID=759273 RepID=A0A1B7XQW5_COLHI|nr:hypothetical protein CH63R_14450 [Colletotrichum higginsianum IMI 349063]OBR02149.1 hypothetical protein CH63R_14450 [Colletotrichum higginsianum IMI 349063]
MSTIHSSDRLSVGENGTINIPSTYLKYVNPEGWDHPTVTPGKATESQVDTFIARSITERRIEGIFGPTLWGRFCLEFGEWDEETFDISSKCMIETLRNTLLQYGVFVEWGRGHGKAAANLMNTLTQDDYQYWSTEEFDRWHKKDPTFRSHCQMTNFANDITIPPKLGDEIREELEQLRRQSSSRAATPVLPPPPSRPFPFHLTDDDNHLASGSRDPPQPTTANPTPAGGRPHELAPERGVRPNPARFTPREATREPTQPNSRNRVSGPDPIDGYQQRDQRDAPGREYRGHNGHWGDPTPTDRPSPKQLSDLTKLYSGNDMKYGGEKYDVLDMKLTIFRENCHNAGITNDPSHLALLNACRGVPEARLCLYNPAATLEGVCGQLRSAIRTAEYEAKATSQFVTYGPHGGGHHHSCHHNGPHEQHFTDRTYHGNGKDNWYGGKSKGQRRNDRPTPSDRKCYVYKQRVAYDKYKANEHTKGKTGDAAYHAFLTIYEGDDHSFTDENSEEDLTQYLQGITIEEENRTKTDDDESFHMNTAFFVETNFDGKALIDQLADQSFTYYLTKADPGIRQHIQKLQPSRPTGDPIDDPTDPKLSITPSSALSSNFLLDRYSSEVLQGILPDTGAAGHSTAGSLKSLPFDGFNLRRLIQRKR